MAEGRDSSCFGGLKLTFRRLLLRCAVFGRRWFPAAAAAANCRLWTGDMRLVLGIWDRYHAKASFVLASQSCLWTCALICVLCVCALVFHTCAFVVRSHMCAHSYHTSALTSVYLEVCSSMCASCIFNAIRVLPYLDFRVCTLVLSCMCSKVRKFACSPRLF